MSLALLAGVEMEGVEMEGSYMSLALLAGVEMEGVEMEGSYMSLALDCSGNGGFLYESCSGSDSLIAIFRAS